MLLARINGQCGENPYHYVANPGFCQQRHHIILQPQQNGLTVQVRLGIGGGTQALAHVHTFYTYRIYRSHLVADRDTLRRWVASWNWWRSSLTAHRW